MRRPGEHEARLLTCMAKSEVTQPTASPRVLSTAGAAPQPPVATDDPMLSGPIQSPASSAVPSISLASSAIECCAEPTLPTSLDAG